MTKKLKVGDIVLIHYNNSLGRIERIHHTKAYLLYDILGADGLEYPNQLTTELTLMKNMNMLRNKFPGDEHESKKP